jgi:mRNA deadenylase 3'-5' endonuclease subunit Ccr4
LGLDNELWRVSEMACSSSWLSFSSFNTNRFIVRSNSDSYNRTNHSNGIQRRWIEAAFDRSLASQHRFTVASYNILADRNASQHADLYVNIPSRYINWDRRQKILSDELFQWNPDIICLQVSNNHQQHFIIINN